MRKKRLSTYSYLRTPEYRYIPLLRIVTLVCFGVMLVSICSVGFFLYENIYTSLGQIEAISALQSTLGYEALDFERLEAVRAAWQNKHTPLPLVAVRDPFRSVSSTQAGPTPAR